jgi:hypothetical protein
MGAFVLLDFTMLRPVLAWRAFWNLWTVYFIFFRPEENRGYWISAYVGMPVLSYVPKMSYACAFSVSCSDIINTRWTNSWWLQWHCTSCAALHLIPLLCVHSNFKQREYFCPGLVIDFQEKLQTERIQWMECSWHVWNAVWHDISQPELPINSHTKYLSKFHIKNVSKNRYLFKQAYIYVCLKKIWCKITHRYEHP